MTLRSIAGAIGSLGLLGALTVGCAEPPTAPTEGSPAIPSGDPPSLTHKPNHGGGGGDGGGGDGGGGGDDGGALYEVFLSDADGAVADPELIATTDCNSAGYLLAKEEKGGRILSIKSEDPDVADPPLLLDFNNTGVAWTRSFDAGKGLSGTFDDGCYGETADKHGAFRMYFEKDRGQPHVLREGQGPADDPLPVALRLLHR